MIYDLSNDHYRAKFRESVDKLLAEADAVVEMKKKSAKRSLSQNAYLHLLLGYFAAQYGCSRDEAKVDFYKRTCNRDLYERRRANRQGVEVAYLRSSADLTKEELALSIDRFRNWSAAEAGIYLPSADDHRMITFAMCEVERAKEYL